MKPAHSNKMVEAPVSWENIHCGAYYRQALEQNLKSWWPKLCGFHLLKIGALSAALDTGDCVISHQINVGIKGECFHVIADPYQLPFANKSADACLLAHTLSYAGNPHRVLREVDRVLIDDGWLVITTFNPVSMLGFGKIFSVLFRCQPYNSRMYTQMRLLDWLGILNFEILYRTHLQVLPWERQEGNLLSTYFSAIGCLSIIIARKRTFPISLAQLKNSSLLRSLRRPINATTHSFLQRHIL